MEVDRPKILAATAQAATATAELALVAEEGPRAAWGIFDDEPIEKLLDAARIAIEIEVAASIAQDDERGQLYAALVKYLEGWAG